MRDSTDNIVLFFSGFGFVSMNFAALLKWISDNASLLVGISAIVAILCNIIAVSYSIWRKKNADKKRIY